MKYYLDTEFLEGTQTRRFLGIPIGQGWKVLDAPYKQTKPTIDLISIGIVCEDGREYYAISKDFNLKEAWNRYDEVLNKHFPLGPEYNKVYWIRENVLLPIHNELVQRWALEEEKANQVSCTTGYNPPIKFSYKNIKKLIDKYGKSNKQISIEIKTFCTINETAGRGIIEQIEPKIKDIDRTIKFYAYYADYDWVVFCWLFGKMIDLPKGFPMYCIDLKQELDKAQETKFGTSLFKGSLANNIKELPKYPKQINEHNALADARWNKQLHEFLNKL